MPQCVPDAVQRERARKQPCNSWYRDGAREWCTADPGPPRSRLWRSRVCGAPRFSLWIQSQKYRPRCAAPGTRNAAIVIDARAAIIAAAIGFLALGSATAAAQTPAPKIWDLKLGAPISELPLNEFVDPACGTNGGPPARVLKNFAEFALCLRERTNGLHEVWFRYDDEMEYVARARRSDIMIRQYQANSLAGQPIITSLLIDDAGLVQGYRIVNDPRVEGDTRLNAFGLADLFKGIAGLGLACTDLLPAEGERPIDDIFVKEICDKTEDGKVFRVEARRYYKAGQYAVDPNENRLTENQFESSARIEVYRKSSP
jgi:hypothetical protein